MKLPRLIACRMRYYLKSMPAVRTTHDLIRSRCVAVLTVTITTVILFGCAADIGMSSLLQECHDFALAILRGAQIHIHIYIYIHYI